jgi:murein DD-endopeptidase MepM/ murein hydrolase activator NlpD
MLPRLIRPFTGTPTITQVFGHNWPGVEPACYLCPDGSISFRPVPGGKLGNWHDGVDYALPLQRLLIAPADGTVIWAGWDTTGFGLKVMIDHGNGYASLLAHTNNVLAGQGSRVKQGHPVALSGTTGNSSGPHLHWSVVRLRGQPLHASGHVPGNPPRSPDG